MHNLIKIENTTGLARDISSHAVISTSVEAFNDYHRRKALAMSKHDQFQKQQEEIDSIKQDISEIKSMLQALMKR